jgi:hypothetical protein
MAEMPKKVSRAMVVASRLNCIRERNNQGTE